MKIHEVDQGSPEWHALRANTRNASEAPAMMGVSPYKSRSALIREKATGITEEITPEMQYRFDRGHETEAKARSILEQDLGEDLYPLVATDDDGYLLASSDGSDMCRTFGFEHKLWNAEIAALVAAGEVPDSHKWQLDQQIEVFGFEKIIFVCSDGTRDNFVSCEYRTTPERIAKLKAGWAMFDQDVANYQPEVIAAKPILTANPLDNLPALVIEVTGRVTHSNLVEFKAAATAVISSIKTDLVTDQDFVDATNAVKYLKDVEDNARRAKQNALDQTTSIAELHRALDEVAKMAGDVRKALDKKISEEKDSRKAEIVTKASQELVNHIMALNERLGVAYMPRITAPFGEAIKGLKSLDSMREKVSVALANAKIEANAAADLIDYNIKTLTAEGNDWKFLFPDLASVCAKAKDDFTALLMSRVSQHKEKEAQRLEAEREKIRAEEQAKAQREAEERAAAEQAERNRVAAEEIRRLDAERKAAAEQAAAANQTKFESAATDACTAGVGVVQISANEAGQVEVKHVVSDAIAVPANACLPKIKLGEICTRLGFTVSAEFLASLGFEATTEKNAKLYNEASFPAICRRISDHTLRVGMTTKLAA